MTIGTTGNGYGDGNGYGNGDGYGTGYGTGSKNVSQEDWLKAGVEVLSV